jgi:hypothetical protein
MRNTATCIALLCLIAPQLGCGSSKDAIDGGEADGGIEVFACIPPTEEAPAGLKPIRYFDSIETVYPSANWRVALEPDTVVGWATFAGADPRESVMTFDLPAAGVEVAGFLVSRRSSAETAAGEVTLVQSLLAAAVPEISAITARVTGQSITSLDGFDTVVGTTLEVTTIGTTDPTELRALLSAALLGRQPADLSFTEIEWTGGRTRQFMVTMQTVRRPAGQTIHLGSITRALDFDDRHRPTVIHAEDLSNGSNLTVSNNGEEKECQGETIETQALADIIWIVDESGSTRGERDNIASNATKFFDKALDFGLDFRMGVTDMNKESLGMFATRDDAEGVGERWLLPDEPEAFAAAIKKPSGPATVDGSAEHGLTQLASALGRHLPRDAGNDFTVRPRTKLAVVILTDERPDEVEDAGIISEGGNKIPSAQQMSATASFVQPYISNLLGENAVVHLIAEPLPYSTSRCAGGEHGLGYYELAEATGGQVGSICQPDLGPTLDAMLASVVGDSSPLALEYVPISSTISVTRDGEMLPRSREYGWDYRGSSNSIVFYGLPPITPADPAEIVIGYRRWATQVVD